MSFRRESLRAPERSGDGRTRRHDLHFLFPPFWCRRINCIAYIRSGILIILLVTAVYGRAVTFSFVDFDDPALVVNHPVVSRGLSLDGLRWAWCEAWQQSVYLIRPLGLTSHMIDVSLFDSWPGGHHLMNVAWHAATAIMLLVWLTTMSGAPGRSLLVSALFAVHPLGADVAAWVAQRSTVLSAFFCLSALIVYQQYLRQPSRRRYWTVFALFLLAVSAKPSAVMFPLVLLLIDGVGNSRAGETAGQRPGKAILAEKIPLFIVAAGIVVMALVVSRSSGAAVSSTVAPLSLRFNNALVSGAIYIVKTVVPAGLCVYYPFPTSIPGWQSAGALALLSGVTVLVFVRRGRAPLAFFGWIWFLITVLPGLGLVQAGPWPAWADHYLYFPLIGLLMTAVWSVPVEKLSVSGKFLSTAAAVGLVLVYGVMGFRQAGFYRDSETLFSRALTVTDKNFMAHTGLGNVLLSQGRLHKAEQQFRRAVDIKPGSPGAHVNLGLVLARTGRESAAVCYYRQALKLNPRFAQAHVNLANLLARQGNYPRAIEHYLTALTIRPQAADINYNLGRVLASSGDFSRADYYFSRARQICPDNKRYQRAREQIVSQGEDDL